MDPQEQGRGAGHNGQQPRKARDFTEVPAATDQETIPPVPEMEIQAIHLHKSMKGCVQLSLLSRVRLLDDEECVDLASDVLALKPSWDRLSEYWGRYKLGAAAFVEGKQGAQEYLRASREKNHLLEFHFWPLYAHLAGALGHQLEAPVRYAESFAKPGFHILLAEENTKAVNGDRHRDEQHLLLPWAVTPDRQAQVCSFTLPIELPAGGGGLFTWPDGDEGVGEYHPYVPGELVIHSGHIVHQAVAIQDGVSEFQQSDRRITLQGHGLWVNSSWVLYL
jgi:hypothetical protein